MAGNTEGQRNQALVERLLDDLGKLMWKMVWDVANHDRWVLEPEEVHADLCLELVKLVNRYGDKPYIELKKLCVTSLRNRVHDLATACYQTSRKAEGLMLSLDGEDQNGQDGEDLPYEEVCSKTKDLFTIDNAFDMDEFCDGMTEDARNLVREVLNPSERTMYFLWLTAQRKQVINTKGFWTLTITPLIMTRAMGWSHDRLKKAWKEVSCAIGGENHSGGGLVAKEGDR